jgi:hypothetical protein
MHVARLVVVFTAKIPENAVSSVRSHALDSYLTPFIPLNCSSLPQFMSQAQAQGFHRPIQEELITANLLSGCWCLVWHYEIIQRISLAA